MLYWYGILRIHSDKICQRGGCSLSQKLGHNPRGRPFGDGTSNCLISSSYARGKACYRSSELLRNPSKYNNKMDMWSLGCIMFEVFTGRKAFTGDIAVLEYLMSGGTLDTILGCVLDKSARDWLPYFVGDLLYCEPSERPSARNLERRLEREEEALKINKRNLNHYARHPRISYHCGSDNDDPRGPLELVLYLEGNWWQTGKGETGGFCSVWSGEIKNRYIWDFILLVYGVDRALVAEK